MLENVKVGDKVVIQNGEIGEVVNVDRDSVDIVANWIGDNPSLPQWCDFDGVVFGYPEEYVVCVIKEVE